MTRVKGGTIHRARRSKVLDQAKGYFGPPPKPAKLLRKAQCSVPYRRMCWYKPGSRPGTSSQDIFGQRTAYPAPTVRLRKALAGSSQG